jgi:predicted AAA+ superfamily ATPase
MGSEGKSIREMARELGRGPSTVSREVRRGLFSAGAAGTAYKPYRDPRLRSASNVADPVYVASWAHRRARGLSTFISGSNAQLLSDELATNLAGRYAQFRVWPLSYAESLALRGLAPGDPAVLRDYLDWGGLPQRFALEPGPETMTYLRDVFASVVLRDIVQRVRARSVAGLEAVIEFAQENLSRVLSPKSLAGYLRASGRALSTDTVYSYLGAMERSLLFQRLRRYDVRGKRVMYRLDKYYATDLGLLASKRIGSGPGPGDKLENAVCVELLARGFDVFTGSAGSGEIDFVAVKDGAPARAGPGGRRAG